MAPPEAGLLRLLESLGLWPPGCSLCTRCHVAFLSCAFLSLSNDFAGHRLGATLVTRVTCQGLECVLLGTHLSSQCWNLNYTGQQLCLGQARADRHVG